MNFLNFVSGRRRSDRNVKIRRGHNRIRLGVEGMEERVVLSTILYPGQAIDSPSHQFELTLQKDGNLVEYGPGGKALWSSGTWNKVATEAVLQADGNFVIRGLNGTAIWGSGTYGHPGDTLHVQNDGNTVISLGSSVLWSTNTPPTILGNGGGGGSALPSKLFAPYVDETSDSSTVLNVNSLATALKTKYLALGFIDSDSSGNPVFGSAGNGAYTNTDYSKTLRNSITALQAAGGDVILSFGGADATELAQTIHSEPALEAAYQKVITFYNIHHVDFDIEGPDLNNTAATSERSLALAQLQKANPGLTISLTLPVATTGLESDGLAVLTNALKAGVKLSSVNIMDMYLTSGNSGSMTAALGEQAATAAIAQLKAAQPGLTTPQAWSELEITTYVDTTNANGFDKNNTTQLVNWAAAKGVGSMSMWWDYTLSKEKTFTSIFETKYKG